MAATLVGYLDDSEEPLAFADIDTQCRLDGDESERDWIEAVLIPGARQAAEAKTGVAIRAARYVERLKGFPADEWLLDRGHVIEIESIEYRDEHGNAQTLDLDDYELATVGNESLVERLNLHRWPRAKSVTITYTAGTEIGLYPGVKQWMLLAAGILYDQRELFLVSQSRQSITEFPESFADYLLVPISVPPRF